MRKFIGFLLLGTTAMAFAGTGIDDLATSMSSSFSSSISTLLSMMRKPFYAAELIFLVLCFKNNPKLSMLSAGGAALVYESIISFILP